MLQILLSHHHVAYLYAGRQTAGDPREHHLSHAKRLDQCRRRRGRGDLAHARQRQHHFLATQTPKPKRPPRSLNAASLFKQFNQASLLFRQGAQNGDCGHMEVPFV